MALRAAWTEAAHGRMAPIEQAKLWAVREVLRRMGEAGDQYTRMSAFVVAAGGGHPDRKAVQKFFARVDKDPSGWFPGKRADNVGRPREMSKTGIEFGLLYNASLAIGSKECHRIDFEGVLLDM